jgi:hypothetical protein
MNGRGQASCSSLRNSTNNLLDFHELIPSSQRHAYLVLHFCCPPPVSWPTKASQPPSTNNIQTHATCYYPRCQKMCRRQLDCSLRGVRPDRRYYSSNPLLSNSAAALTSICLPVFPASSIYPTSCQTHTKVISKLTAHPGSPSSTL